jgi:putative transposase
VKYAFIKDNQRTFSVTRMCDLMEVSPSAYYDWLKRPESRRILEDRRLALTLREIDPPMLIETAPPVFRRLPVF